MNTWTRPLWSNEILELRKRRKSNKIKLILDFKIAIIMQTFSRTQKASTGWRVLRTGHGRVTKSHNNKEIMSLVFTSTLFQKYYVSKIISSTHVWCWLRNVLKSLVMWAENFLWDEKEARKSICASSAWDDKSLDLVRPSQWSSAWRDFKQMISCPV